MKCASWWNATCFGNNGSAGLDRRKGRREEETTGEERSEQKTRERRVKKREEESNLKICNELYFSLALLLENGPC